MKKKHVSLVLSPLIQRQGGGMATNEGQTSKPAQRWRSFYHQQNLRQRDFLRAQLMFSPIAFDLLVVRGFSVNPHEDGQCKEKHI